MRVPAVMIPIYLGDVIRLCLHARQRRDGCGVRGPICRYANRRSDRERIALILTGRRLGFTLAEIKRLVDGPDGKNLHLTREKCVEQINLLERQKRGIELALRELRQIYTSFYKPSLDDQVAC